MINVDNPYGRDGKVAGNPISGPGQEQLRVVAGSHRVCTSTPRVNSRFITFEPLQRHNPVITSVSGRSSRVSYENIIQSIPFDGVVAGKTSRRDSNRR